MTARPATVEPDLGVQPVTRAPRACPACGAFDDTVFFCVSGIPVHCNVLWDSPEEARRAPRGDVELVVCPACGLIFNAAFDPSLVHYGKAYENSLYGSPTFRAYATSLVEHLTNRFALAGKLVVEIGCGKGEFLRQLCRHAKARGIGIDASYEPGLDEAAGNEDVQFVRERFETLDPSVRPDLICFRQVLEHIPTPHAFLTTVAAAARRTCGGAVFVEVPNALFTIRDFGVFDILYEHCTYFTAPSLTALFEEVGLNVLNVYPTFGEQYLCLEARACVQRPGASHEDEVAELQALCAAFGGQYEQQIGHWEERLSGWHRAGRRVAVWGAGTKGVMFVNSVPGGAQVRCLVDVNARKQGRFVPGTGQPVLAPVDLADAQVDVVIAMNSIYRDEIEADARRLGVAVVEVIQQKDHA